MVPPFHFLIRKRMQRDATVRGLKAVGGGGVNKESTGRLSIAQADEWSACVRLLFPLQSSYGWLMWLDGRTSVSRSVVLKLGGERDFNVYALPDLRGMRSAYSSFLSFYLPKGTFDEVLVLSPHSEASVPPPPPPPRLPVLLSALLGTMSIAVLPGPLRTDPPGTSDSLSSPLQLSVCSTCPCFWHLW